MRDSGNRFRLIKHLLASALAFLSAMVLWGAALAEPSAENGRIEVRSLYDYQESQQLMLDARIKLTLPSDVVEALHHEIPIAFETDITLDESRSLLGIPYQRNRVRIQYQTRLQYYGFNQAWVLHNQRNQKVQSFSTLEEALDTLGTLSGFALTNLATLHPNTEYHMGVRMSLNRWALPSPMMIDALFSSAWHLDSDWKTIQIQSPKSWL
ncbi:DUF4390 domain-containing protein [Thiomicrospira sp. WB1]|uniref:DUF4390 domain-containing protein n=1 Tax=Thiomicrospira sp. WB1 TaxID=1685380 RepID=UPI0007465F82|nr:DUF4390 domain-containing protein [Thiomicrospira sp. WB1]KUJ71201.1 hypothetical protein AVO41_10090 [Thiomicrospira sp. WB1]